jgi:AraC family transcriptional regulator, regulatory protein of adaptative response / DNA-3-methyladenine glycosylase II
MDLTMDLTLQLAYRPPLATGPLLSFLAQRAIPGVEEVDGATVRRAVRTRDGRPAVMALALHPTKHLVTIDVSLGETPEPGIVRGGRRMLDLDADPAAIDDVLTGDPALRPLVRRTPGIRLPGTTDEFELLVRAVLGQQVSVRGARTVAARIAARFGTALDRPAGTITHLFPTPERLADAPPGDFGVPAGRAETIRQLAGLVAAGTLDLSATADQAKTLQTLGEVPGVGPWTTAYLAMRGLRDTDAFPAGDLWVRRGFEALGMGAKPAEIRARAEGWRPWRAYAVMHLWHMA